MIDATKMIRPLVNDDFHILWELLPGKPDSSQKLEDPCNDQRDRVPQSMQKAHTCWWYAPMGSGLCIRYGKNCEGFERERALEKTISTYRKQCTFTETVHHESERILLKIATQWTRARVSSSEQALELFNSTFNGGSPATNKKGLIEQEALNLMREFVASIGSDFWEKLNGPFGINDTKVLQEALSSQFTERTLEVIQCTIGNLPISEGKLLQGLIYKEGVLLCKLEKDSASTDSSPEKVFAVSNSQKKEILKKAAILKYYYTQIGLQQASWNPGQPMSALIKELQNWGPILASGKFGSDFYKGVPPTLLIEKVVGRRIYGWKPPAVYDPDQPNLFRHSVVVLGAQELQGQKSQGRVYFSDPNNLIPIIPSCPDPLEPRTIFTVSYERFCSAVSDMWFGTSCAQSIEEQCYLLYNPKLPNFQRI